MKYLKMALLFCFAMLLAIDLANCHAQENSSPESVASLLKAGTPASQIQLAAKLGVKGAGPQRGLESCDIQTDRPSLEHNLDTAILRVLCGSDFNLILFGRAPRGQWGKLDSVDFYDPYDALHLRYQSLIHPGIQEIAIDNAATVSGNLYQAYFLVIRVISGHFKTALAIYETGYEPHFGSSPRILKSTINIHPATPTSVGEIAQLAKVTDGKRSFDVSSTYSWNESLGAFSKDGIDVISRQK